MSKGPEQETMAKLETLIYSTDTPLRPQDSPIPSQINSIGYRELKAGVSAWRNKPKTQIAEEVASLCQETKRIPDPYFYEIKPNGELLSPVTGKLVKEDIKRENITQELEYQSFLQVESWVRSKESGVIAWISPPEMGAYSVSKIIVSEIRDQDGKKILFNRAIVLDIDEIECLKFAQSLANYSQNKPNFSSKDELRVTPIELDTNIHWSYVVEELLPGLSLQQVRTGEDLVLKSRAVLESLALYNQVVSDTGEVNISKFVNLVGSSRMVGERGSSCPPKSASAFDTIINNSLPTGENCSKIKCKKCSWEASENEAQQVTEGKLTCCPRCGWKPGEPKE